MSTYFERHQRRRLITSYVSVVLTITLVLFIAGAFGLLALNMKKMTDHFKEQVAVTVFLKDETKGIEIKILEKKLLLKLYTKTATFISKEKAAEVHSEVIGEDFMSFLGYNPLQNSIDLHIKADFLTPEYITTIKKDILSNRGVSEVIYDKPLISLLNKNSKDIALWIIIITAVFMIIVTLLINSSIRLSIYSKRFIIKTMQMVGATKKFIRRPFILRSIRWGILGALIAISLISIGLYYLEQFFPNLKLLSDSMMLTKLFSGILTLGIIIPWVTTFLAAQRFLNLKTDDLYY